MDFYGLAAGLAASWAVLVASKSAVLEKDMAYDMLYNCAYLIQKVRLRAHALAHSALHRLLLNRLRAVQAVGRWGSVSESDVWGQAATAAVLTQFYPRLATVLVWLANAAEPRVPRQFILQGRSTVPTKRAFTASAAWCAPPHTPGSCSPCGQPAEAA